MLVLVRAQPDHSLIAQTWERGKNARQIAECLKSFDLLSAGDRELLLVGISLEAGTLPLIHQYGQAEFRPVDSDHRIITPKAGELDREATDSSAAGTATARNSGTWSPALGAGTPSARAATEGTQAGSTARQHLRRTYGNVGEVIEEDSRDLALYFPQFSPVLYDHQLGMWYREGRLQPLESNPSEFVVKFYYHSDPLALPIVVAAPIRIPSPHLWRQEINGRIFPSLCYTFAPDGTIVRGRDFDDTAAEVLRQVVLWLIKHLVWCRFQFWPGAEVGHDPAEIEQFTRPDDPCPAHSWRRYGECCRPKNLLMLKQRTANRFGVNPARRLTE